MYWVRVASYSIWRALDWQSPSQQQQNKVRPKKILCPCDMLSLVHITYDNRDYYPVFIAVEGNRNQILKTSASFQNSPNRFVYLSKAEETTTIKSIKVSGWCKYHQKIFFRDLYLFFYLPKNLFEDGFSKKKSHKIPVNANHQIKM